MWNFLLYGFRVGFEGDVTKMKQDFCPNCGADTFIYKDGAKFCKYCNSRFEVEKEEKKRGAEVSLQSDIDILLEKCKTDPARARRYAGLILDIDPTNREAKKYLK